MFYDWFFENIRYINMNVKGFNILWAKITFAVCILFSSSHIQMN